MFYVAKLNMIWLNTDAISSTNCLLEDHATVEVKGSILLYLSCPTWHCSSPTSERVLGDLDHLRAVDLEADDLQVLEDEVGEGADEAVVDKQVLDDRVAAGVRPERLRQQREVDRLALNGKSLGLGVEVAETGRLEVGGRRVLRPGTLTGNAGNAA